MMSKHLLLLNLYLMKHNLGSLVFKCGGVSARIDKLCDALQFVGRMKQLSMAIDSGADQDCAYRLNNLKGLAWILYCRFAKGIVALELWLEKLGFNEGLVVPFEWRGSVEGFRHAVNRMIEKMGPYRFIW
jgi:hypothetical protein